MQPSVVVVEDDQSVREMLTAVISHEGYEVAAFANAETAPALIVLAVGGIGIANIMVISVIERRGEIGLRRSLGATRKPIGSQFIIESTMLSLLGGFLGVALGVAIVLGAFAGLYPAWRASKLDTAEAVRPAA